jgi:hypothetical protein
MGLRDALLERGISYETGCFYYYVARSGTSLISIKVEDGDRVVGATLTQGSAVMFHAPGSRAYTASRFPQLARHPFVSVSLEIGPGGTAVPEANAWITDESEFVSECLALVPFDITGETVDLREPIHGAFLKFDGGELSTLETLPRVVHDYPVTVELLARFEPYVLFRDPRVEWFKIGLARDFDSARRDHPREASVGSHAWMPILEGLGQALGGIAALLFREAFPTGNDVQRHVAEPYEAVDADGWIWRWNYGRGSWERQDVGLGNASVTLARGPNGDWARTPDGRQLYARRK